MKKKSRASAAGSPARRRSNSLKTAGKPPAKSRAAAPGGSKTRSKTAPDLGAAAPDLERRVRQLKAQLASAREQIETLRRSADTDFMLDILNRRGFERELNRSIAYIGRYGATGAVVMLDVDGLKPINDNYGHAAGDAMLKAVAAALRRHVRASDLLGRLGGDEFALLLWNLSEADASTKAASLEAAVDQLEIVVRGQSVRAGASAGVAILGPGAEAAAVLAQADHAMYARKAERRSQQASPERLRR